MWIEWWCFEKIKLKLRQLRYCVVWFRRRAFYILFVAILDLEKKCYAILLVKIDEFKCEKANLFVRE